MRKRIDTCNSNTNEKSPNDTKIEDLKSFKYYHLKMNNV